MAEIVNLNRACKTRAKAAKAAEAEANRVKFGRSNAEKKAARVALVRREQALDGMKRE